MLEKEMPTHSIILAWEVLWTEEPGRLQFMGSQNSQTWLSQSVVPRHLCTGNPWVIWGLRTPVTVHLQRYNQHCISLVPHPRIQPAMVCVVLQYVFVGKINLRYRWILAVQTHVVQGSTVHWHCCTAVTSLVWTSFIPNEVTCILKHRFTFCPVLSPQALVPTKMFLDLPVLDNSHPWNRNMCTILCLLSITVCSDASFHICSIYGYLILE